LKLKVCRDSNGLAPPEDVSSGNYDEREYFRLKEEDPVSGDGVNRWQEAIDGWIAGQEDKDKYFPPEDYCRSGGRIMVDFSSPRDGETVGNEFDVRLETTSLTRVVEARFWLNGEGKQNWTERPFETKLKLENGKYTLRAKVKDKDGNEAEKEIKIGVNMAWNWEPSPTPTVTPKPTVTVVLTPTIVVPTATLSLVITVTPLPTVTVAP